MTEDDIFAAQRRVNDAFEQASAGEPGIALCGIAESIAKRHLDEQFHWQVIQTISGQCFIAITGVKVDA